MRTLLIVDDDPFQRKILRSWFQDSDWQVAEAESVAQALEQIQRVHIVLVDLRLGDEDGFEVARRVPALSLVKPPLLVAMSADMSEAVRARCREAGFAHTLAKPFQRDNVLDVVRILSASGEHAPAGGDGSASKSDVLGEVPKPLRDVPALAALWRMEQTSSEPELVPAVEGLRQAGRMLASAADGGPQSSRTVAAAAHGLVGAAGILGCTRVEVTSKALASKVRERGLDGETRLLISVIENEVETAVEGLLAKIESARQRSSYQ